MSDAAPLPSSPALRPSTRRSWVDVLFPVLVLLRRWGMVRQFLGRSIARRYRLSAFGFLWVILMPLFTLAIYTFVFGTVLQGRWGAGGAQGVPDTASFGITLFTGLIVFWLFAEVMTQAPGAVIEHTNLVKKAVFPLEITPIVVVGSALFHGLLSTAVLIGALALVGAPLHATALLFPVVLLPYLLLLLGMAWFLAALCVYFRDIAHIVGLLTTGILFLSPVFYPIERLSQTLQSLVMLNPISFIVLQARRVLLAGEMPDWAGLGIYALVAWVVSVLGLAFFLHLRKGFGDVL